MVCTKRSLLSLVCLGKWNNLFTANVKVTNTVQENLAVTDVIGEYMNKGTGSNVLLFMSCEHHVTVMRLSQKGSG